MRGGHEQPRIELLPAGRHARKETAAFDVLVEGFNVGRWVEIEGERGEVTWSNGAKLETGSCDADPERISAALRDTVERERPWLKV